jgi:putative tryptophan/tyrosine transport system substrate-binding protein
VKRREFITFVGGVATWPLVAGAQQLPVVAVFNSGRVSTQTKNLSALRDGLKESGFIERQNIAIEFLWGDNQFDKLPALAAEQVARMPAVIVSNTLAALAAKKATTTLPIVFTTGSDPVREGLVSTLNRPGGNVTGVVFITGALGAKRLELLSQIAPKTKKVGVVIYPNTPETEGERTDLKRAAQVLGLPLVVAEVRGIDEIEGAFLSLIAGGAGALYVGTGPFMFTNLERLVAQAARSAVPAIFSTREYVEAGGLISYGATPRDAFRQAGIYAGRIIKGENPADLPVIQSTKFDFVINLKTAKALGLEIPPQLVATADEVIE